MNSTIPTAIIEQITSPSDELVENSMVSLLSNSKTNDNNLLYTMEQMELIRRLKKTGITAEAVIKVCCLVFFILILV